MTNFNQISLRVLNLIEIYNISYHATRDIKTLIGISALSAKPHISSTIISSPIFILNINNVINLPENLFQPF